MHIEIFHGGDDEYYYRTVNGSRTTTGTEGFASRSNAKRAAHAHIRAMLKPCGVKPTFSMEEVTKKSGAHVMRIEWWS